MNYGNENYEFMGIDCREHEFRWNFLLALKSLSFLKVSVFFSQRHCHNGNNESKGFIILKSVGFYSAQINLQV